MNVQYDNKETEILSRERGEIIAKNFYRKGQRDPFPKTQSTLLSADEIVDYVQRTGAISPFYVDGKSSRLKKASYEGRIGEKAYRYDENGKLAEILEDGQLIVEANSIVFVECDLDFRLPDFIALRFNLQIRHVHRGLLLGTGPLVDPGFWGKLCIPLHNLTNENYCIPKEEGLIWIELNKTSGSVRSGRSALSSDSELKEYWDIRRNYIEKAARPFDERRATYSIRSSIPIVEKEARDAAKGAENAAKSAQENVKIIRNVGILTIVGIVISLFVLFSEFYTHVTAIYNSVVPEFNQDIKSLSEKMNLNEDKLNQDSQKMSIIIEKLVQENENLHHENMEIRQRILRLESSANE